ncbi:MAG: hypothetical protein JW876_00570 [Candidatus Krumholzibacteriota bacterium]|nr:hypothetical protein [Candidatus Krumholzibacteriota bacterium]
MLGNKRTEYSKYKESHDAWQTKTQMLIRLPFPLPWIIIAGILFLIGWALVFFSGENSNTLRLLALESALIAAIANSVVFFEMLLDDIASNVSTLLNEEEDRAKEWISDWYQNIFWSRKNMLVGLFLGSICFFLHVFVNISVFHSMTVKIYSSFNIFVIGFLGGSMFWTMLGIAGLTNSLGKDVNIKASIFDSKTSFLRLASSMIWKVSLTASSVYILGISMYFFCLQINEYILAIVMIFGAIILLYYILPQINIHKTLLEIKHSKLQSLVKQIDLAFDNVAAQPTAENINQLRDLFHLQDIVNGKRSWAFGIGELLKLIGSVLIPLLLFMCDYGN